MIQLYVRRSDTAVELYKEHIFCSDIIKNGLLPLISEGEARTAVVKAD